MDLSLILLTKSTTPVIGWVATLLGYIMKWLFAFTGTIGGTPSLGWSIILFTIATNIILLPMTIKQQKQQKITNFMQPEIQAIQAKYKGKEDKISQQKMQAEMQAVYDKYGTSMFGGCGPLLLQLPIFFALYQVILKIPGYIPQVYNQILPVASEILSVEKAAGFSLVNLEVLQPVFTNLKISTTLDFTEINNVIDFLYKLTPEHWEILQQQFPNVAMSGLAAWLEKINTFAGLNLSRTPWQGLTPNWAWSIPILAGVTQWLSTKLMTVGQPGAKKEHKEGEPEDPTAASMRSMNVIMPLMSVYFCFTFSAGVGVYWIVSAVVRTIQQIILNKTMKDVDVDALVAKNLEKVNAKRAKQGLPPKKVDQKAINDARRAEAKEKIAEEKAAERKEKTAKHIIDSTAYYNTAARPDSLTARANMVAMFDKRQEEIKRGKKKPENNSETENKTEVKATEEKES